MRSRRPTRGLGACLAAVLLAACCGAERAYFRPTDNLVEVPGRGYLAIASYPLVDSQGRSVGQLRLDSQGIFEAEFVPADGRQTVLGVELMVTNTSTVPMVLPPDRQTVDNLDGIPKLFPYLVFVDGVRSGQIDVPPDSARQVDLFYRIPSGTNVGALEDFLFHWHVQVDSEEKAEFTHFIRMPPTSYYYPAYAYSGYWNGYFFPGYYTIPPWGMGIYFAPPIFPYYEEPYYGPGHPPPGAHGGPAQPPPSQPSLRPPVEKPQAENPPPSHSPSEKPSPGEPPTAAPAPPPQEAPPTAPPAPTPPPAEKPPAASPPAEQPQPSQPPASHPPPSKTQTSSPPAPQSQTPAPGTED